MPAYVACRLPLILAVALALSLAGAAPPPDVRTDHPAPGQNGEPAPGVVRTPMMVEIDDLVAEERKECERLHRAFLAATDETQALALQREIEATKRATEIGILEVQLRYARKEGRHEAVEALNKSLRKLRARSESRPLSSRTEG